MKRKNIRKIAHLFAALATVMISHGTFAKVPPTAFKGVSKHFRRDHKFFDVTLGEVALETGLIYDLRFFGNFTAGIDSEGNRQYIDDRSDDPMWNMVKILFPSSGGSLSEQTSAKLDFGHNVNETETVALLMNYVNALRAGKEIKEADLKKKLITGLKKEFKNTAEELQNKATLEQTIADIDPTSVKTAKELREQIKTLQTTVKKLAKIELKENVDKAIKEAGGENEIERAESIKKSALKALDTYLMKRGTETSPEEKSLKERIKAINTSEIKDAKSLKRLMRSIQNEVTKVTDVGFDKSVNRAIRSARSITLTADTLKQRANDFKSAVSKKLLAYPEFESQMKKISDLKIDTIKSPKNLKDHNRALNNIVRTITDDELKKEITEAIKVTQKGHSAADTIHKMTKIKESVSKVIENTYQQKIMKRKKSFEEDFKSRTIDPLLTAIKGAIKNEKDSLYPDHTIEQVLSAFFCSKFNTQQDIWDLLENLDGSIIVDKKMIPQKEEYLQEEDLPKIARKSKPYQVDELFDLLEADLWTALTPYKPGVSPTSNGPTLRYDRNTDKHGTETFPDCAEKTANHIMNMLLFDSVKREYDLSHIRKYMEDNNIISANFKNFAEYYENRDPLTANAGDLRTRSEWNRVVGDLNTPEDPIKIVYKHDGKNETRAGFLNFIKTCQKMFALSLEDYHVKEDLGTKKQWLEKSLQTIFMAVNPTKTYQFDLSKVRINEFAVDNDLTGDIGVIVSDDSDTPLYSYNFHAAANKHSAIENLQVLLERTDTNYEEVMNTHSHSITPGTAEESLWNLSSNRNFVESKITEPLYALFGGALFDNDSKIGLLNKIIQKFELWKKGALSSSKNLAALKAMVLNVLNDVSWDDRVILQAISPVLKKLSTIQEFRGILGESVKGYFSQKEKDEELKDTIKLCKNIKSLDLSENNNLKNIVIDSLSNLENLILNQKTTYQEVSLKNLPIEKLLHFEAKATSLENLSHLKALDMKNLESAFLKNLSSLEKIYGDLKGRVTFEGDFFKLKKLFFYKSKISEIKFINFLSSLEEINLSSTTELKRLDLEGHKKLAKVDLSNSKIENVLFKDLPALEQQKIADINTLKSILFEGESNLKELEIRNTSLEAIKLDTLLKLETLKLTQNKNMKRSFSLSNLDKLRTIDLRTSSFKKVILENLANLTRIELNRSCELEEIILNNMENVDYIDLQYLQLDDNNKVKKIVVSNLPKLERIDGDSELFYYSKGKLDISLKNLVNLEEMYFSYSFVKVHLENLPKWEELDFRDTDKLGKLVVKNLKNLDTIAFSGSKVEDVTLENLPKVTSLNFHQSNNLKALIVSGLSNLQDLNLQSSGVSTLLLKNLSSLRELDLRNMSNLTSVRFEGDFSDLTTLRFSNSSKLTAIEGLEHLSHLTKLDCSDTPKMKTLSFGEDLKDLELNIRGSGITRTSIRGIDHLDIDNIER